jgi:branched-chain amino acid transport system substrate-binding protein
VGVALVLLAACTGDGDDGDGSPTSARRTTTTARPVPRGNVDGELRIGTLLPMTGALSSLGPSTREGVRMAVRDINEAGGVLGKPVVLGEADDATDEETARTELERLLTTDEIDGVVGPIAPRLTLTAVDRLVGARAVGCSPANSLLSLATAPDEGWYFRTVPSDRLQMEALAQLVHDDGHQRVAVVASNDEYGRGLAGRLGTELKERSREVVADVAFDPAGASFAADAERVAATTPNAVVLLASTAKGGAVLRSLIDKGVGPAAVAVYVADALQTDTLAAKVNPDDPAAVQGIKGTAPAPAPGNGAAFFSRAFAQFAPGIEPLFAAHAYDCAVVLALAAEAAGSDDPSKLVRRMIDVTRDGTACSTFAECKTLLVAGTDVAYDGASGPLDLVEPGEPGVGTFDVFQFQADGRYQVLRQVTVVGQQPPGVGTTTTTVATSMTR